MLRFLINLYSYCNNYFYLFAFVFALCYAGEKRSMFWARAAAFLVGGTALTFAYSLIPAADIGPLIYILKYFFCFFIALAGALCSFRMKPRSVVYYAICGYSFQHLCYSLTLIVQAAAALAGLEFRTGSGAFMLTEFLVTASVFAFMFFVYRRMIAGAADILESEKLILPFALLLVFAVVFSVLGFNYDSPRERLLLGGYAALLCMVMLYAMYKVSQIARAVNEKRTAQALAAKQKEQYEAYRKNIDYINEKCHDLKRQIEYLRGGVVSDEKIAEMKRIISIYDNTASTGNETLDVILSENGLRCEREGISFTYMADGALLSFMDAVDICAVFCNLLDNAVEAASHIAERDRRMISLRISRMGNLAHIVAINSYRLPLERDEDGFRTTKQDKAAHGFGLKSIKAVVGAYNGEMKIYADGGVFEVNILLPVPEVPEI